jgi:hypothetical protein
MKKSIFILVLISILACKKEDEPQPDNRTSATLKVIYRCSDPDGMNVWLTSTDQFYFNEHKNMPEYIFTGQVKNGQNIQGSASNSNFWGTTLIVVYAGDTLFNQTKITGNSFNIDL